MSKKRKWSDAYVKYGFTLKVGKDGIERPQCMSCDKLLSNSSLKPCKLNEHFLNVHCGKGTENEFAEKRKKYDTSATLPTLGFAPVEKPLIMASLEVAYIIGKQKQPYTAGEGVIKPASAAMNRILIGKDAEKKILQVFFYVFLCANEFFL